MTKWSNSHVSWLIRSPHPKSPSCKLGEHRLSCLSRDQAWTCDQEVIGLGRWGVSSGWVDGACWRIFFGWVGMGALVDNNHQRSIFDIHLSIKTAFVKLNFKYAVIKTEDTLKAKNWLVYSLKKLSTSRIKKKKSKVTIFYIFAQLLSTVGLTWEKDQQ